MMTVDVQRGVDEVVHTDKLDFYDFNWQGHRKPKPFTLKRGDRTRVDCVYEVGAGKEVGYGLGSSEEMCIWFMGYYPRIRSIPGVGDGTLCGPSPGGQWEGFCGSNGTNTSTRHVLNSAADLDSNDKAMGTARTFGVAPQTCAASPSMSPSMSPAMSSSMSPSMSAQPAPTKSPLPPNSPTQSPLVPSMSPSTPSSPVAIPSTAPKGPEPPTQSPSTADALRNTGFTEGPLGDDDSSAWWVPVVICVPVLIAGGGISVWLFGRRSKQVGFKDNIDEISQVSMSHSPYGMEPKVLRPQQVRIISSSEEGPNTSV